jgi:hypothetical protein
MSRKFVLVAAVIATLALPGGTALAADVPLDLEPGATLHYSGPIGVANLYWSTSWDATERSNLNAATGRLASSDYAAKLAQYGVPGFTWKGEGTADPLCPSAQPTVSTVRIAAFLVCEEALGRVPAAGGTPWDFSTATMIYNVIVPNTTTVFQLPFGLGPQSCVPGGFGGFHFYTPSGPRFTGFASPFQPIFLPIGRPILFTIIPRACVTRAEDLLPIISHELVEASTDPVPIALPPIATPVAGPQYWIDESNAPFLGRNNPLNWPTLLSKGEAGDVCTALYLADNPATLRQRVQAEFSHVPYAGTRVGAYWSNADHACVVGPNRLVWARFRSTGSNGPTDVSVNGGSPQALPHDELVYAGMPYKFSNVDPPGRRHVYFGDCEGNVPFPGTTDAAATKLLECAAVLQDQVTFTATGLDGKPWRVWFNGIPHDGPVSTWFADGNPFPFTFEDVPGCTFTGATPASPVYVSGGPVTVTGNYNCAQPPLPPCSTYADAVRWTHPTAYWRLGDTGPTARDSGPFGLDGTYEPGVLTGVPGGIRGDLDTAAAFSGSGVVVPSYFGLDLTGNAVSVEVWAKGGPQAPYAYLVSKSDYHGTYGYSLYAGQNATLRFFFGNGSSRITDEANFVWDGNWHHIVGVYDGSSVKLYVDSALVANTPASGSIASSFGTPLTIGRWQGGGFAFAGTLDEVAVYDHALTADQIRVHYAVGTGGWGCA